MLVKGELGRSGDRGIRKERVQGPVAHGWLEERWSDAHWRVRPMAAHGTGCGRTWFSALLVEDDGRATG